MRKYGEHSVEWEEISPNRIRMGALQIFLLFPQILYELWEKKNKEKEDRICGKRRKIGAV